jgi:hypothetical protein
LNFVINIWDVSQVNLHNEKWSKAQGCLKLNTVYEAVNTIFKSVKTRVGQQKIWELRNFQLY